MRALRKASVELGFRNAKLITWDRDGRIEKGGVEIELIPPWKFLLEDYLSEKKAPLTS